MDQIDFYWVAYTKDHSIICIASTIEKAFEEAKKKGKEVWDIKKDDVRSWQGWNWIKDEICQ